MNLPNYFLADLPAEASLSASLIAEGCQTLKRNRAQYLRHLSTESRIHLLSEVASKWLDPEYTLRKHALEMGPAATDFSAPMLACGLDSFFGELKPGNLHALLAQELGHAHRLDLLVSSEPEQQTNRAATVTGPELLVQVVAESNPISVLTSMVFGVLLRSAQFVRCGKGTAFLPRLFAHSLYESEPKLGACMEVAEWRAQNSESEGALFEAADLVTALGTHESLDGLRLRVPWSARFLGCPQGAGFAFVSNTSLSGGSLRQAVQWAGADVAAWDQHGSLAPHVIYVQRGGTVPPELFAQLLAEELEKQEQVQPRGELSVEATTAITSRRSIYEMRAAHSDETRLFTSKNSTAWTVVFETDPRFQFSCLNRFIYVKAVTDLNETLGGAEPVRGKTSTVGLAVAQEQLPGLVSELAQWGAERVCPLGRMQRPSLAARLGTRPSLRRMVTWTDWEK